MNTTDSAQEWLLRPVPFGMTVLYFVLLTALVVVQALIARQKGEQPWWDVVATSMAIVFPGVVFYLAALTLNYAGIYSASSAYFDINRGWLLVGAGIGNPLLMFVLWRSVRQLAHLHREGRRNSAGTGETR